MADWTELQKFLTDLEQNKVFVGMHDLRVKEDVETPFFTMRGALGTMRPMAIPAPSDRDDANETYESGCSDIDTYFDVLKTLRVPEEEANRHTLISFPISGNLKEYVVGTEVKMPGTKSKEKDSTEVKSTDVDVNPEENVTGVIADDAFKPGSTIVMAPGKYRGPIHVTKSCVIKADGDVMISSKTDVFVVNTNVSVKIKGKIVISDGDIAVSNGKVRLSRCSVSSCVNVTKNGNVVATGVKFGGGVGDCIRVNGNGKMEVKDCPMRGCGVLVEGGELHMCDINDWFAGRFVGGVTVISGWKMERAAGHLIEASSSARVSCVSSKLVGLRGGCSVSATDESVVKLDKCELRGKSFASIIASHGGTVICTNLEGPVTNPVVIKEAGVVKLTKCEVNTVFVSDSVLDMRDCTVCKAVSSGVVAVGDSRIHVENTTFKECEVCGLEAAAETICTVTKCRFESNKTVGALVLSTISTFHACTFNGNVVGCKTDGDAMCSVFSECDFDDNSVAGLVVVGRSGPQLVKCRFRKQVEVGAIIDGGRGSFVSCEFSDNQGVALDARGQANTGLSKCKFNGNHGTACQISGDCTNLKVSETDFNHNCGPVAVFADSNAVGTFKECRFDEQIGYDMDIGGGAVVHLDQCVLLQAKVGIGVYVHDKAEVNIQLSELKHVSRNALFAASNSRVNIADTIVSMCGSYGLVFSEETTAVLQRVKLERNGACGSVYAIDSSVKLEACMIESSGQVPTGIIEKGRSHIDHDSGSIVVANDDDIC